MYLTPAKAKGWKECLSVLSRRRKYFPSREACPKLLRSFSEAVLTSSDLRSAGMYAPEVIRYSSSLSVFSNFTDSIFSVPGNGCEKSHKGSPCGRAAQSFLYGNDNRPYVSAPFPVYFSLPRQYAVKECPLSSAVTFIRPSVSSITRLSAPNILSPRKLRQYVQFCGGCQVHNKQDTRQRKRGGDL